jgi:hypothetical protein
MDATGSTSIIILHSGRLEVEIALPGTVYRRTRFDWTSFITQVTLDGQHTFCVPEDYDSQKGTGGIGFCCEFGNEKAIGYVDARPGEFFPKPGIGLLVRPGEGAYNFFHDYEVARPFPIHIESGPDFARFTVDPLDCQGYAVRLVREMRVMENRLEITCTLENTGTQAIHTHEYCHNFTGIDCQPVGAGYHLQFPYPLQFEDMSESYRSFLPKPLQKITPHFVLKQLVASQMVNDVLSVSGGDVRWKWTPKKSFFGRPLGFFKTDQPQWKLVYEPTGVRAQESDDFSPARVALWGAAHVISAEVYVDIDLEPGQSQTWTRRYMFSC